MPADEPPKPTGSRRGGGLKAVLFVVLAATILSSIAGLFSVAASDAPEDPLEPSPLPRRLLLLSLLGLVNVGCAVGVWGRKKWGVYGVVCCSLVAFMLNWKIAGPMIALPGLAGPFLVGLIAGLMWLDFD